MAESNRKRVERLLREVCIEVLHFARSQEGKMPTSVEIKQMEKAAADFLPPGPLEALAGFSDKCLRDELRKHVEPGLRQWITGRMPS